jgi:hypothetical protein
MGIDLLWCVADGSGGWWLCLAISSSLFSVSPFTTFIVFDLGNAAVSHTGGRYGWGFPLPMPVKAVEFAFPSVLNFSMLLTRFSSVLGGPFAIMT